MEFLSDHTELTVAFVSILAAIAFSLWTLRKQAGFRRTAQQLRAVSQFRKHLLDANSNAYLTIYEDDRCVFSEDLQALIPDLNNCKNKNMIIDFLSDHMEKRSKKLDPLRALNNFTPESFENGWPIVIDLSGNKIEISGRLVCDPVLGSTFILLWFHTTRSPRATQKLSANQSSANMAVRTIEAMTDSLPIPIWYRDESGSLRWINNAYAAAVEAENKAIVLSDQIELLRSGVSEDDRTLAEKTLSSGKLQTQQGSLVVDGNRKTFQMSEYPAPDKLGGTFGFALDITKEQDLDAEFRRQELGHTETLNSLSTPVAIF